MTIKDGEGYELRTFRVVYYAEHGLCDNGGRGYWDATIESHPFPTKIEAEARMDKFPSVMMDMRRVRENLEPVK